MDNKEGTPECANGHGRMSIEDDGGGNFWAECRVCGNNEEENEID